MSYLILIGEMDMINKQSLWFLTLFSLILVLSVYYITMPNELLLTNNSNYLESKNTSKEEDSDTKVTIEESELLVTMRVNLEEERSEQIADLKNHFYLTDLLFVSSSMISFILCCIC